MTAIATAGIGPMVPEAREILATTRETLDTFTLKLGASGRGDGRGFAPGQFNMLYLFGLGEAAISISGDPGRPEALIHTIRAVGTVTRAMQSLRRGASIGVRGPYGTAWPLDEAKGRDVVLVAGGIGLAPLRPAIYQLFRHRQDYGRIVILYGAADTG